MSQTVSAELPGMQDSPERPLPFLPTPERVSQYLELKTEEVSAQMKSAEGRQQLFDQLMTVEGDIRQDHADFHPETMRSQMDEVAASLSANEKFLQTVKSPEQKGLFSRAWEAVKGFPRKHPVVTTLLALAAAAGGVAAGFYMAGSWELLLASVGLDKVIGAGEAASELIPSTIDTAPLPGGGVLDIPPATSPSDLGIQG